MVNRLRLLRRSAWISKPLDQYVAVGRRVQCCDAVLVCGVVCAVL